MQKVILGVLMAVLVVGAAVAGIQIQKAGAPGDVTSQLAAELSTLREDLSSARREISSVAEEVRSLQSVQDALAAKVKALQVPVALATATDGEGEEGTPSTALLNGSDGLRGYVMAVLEEDRKLQEEEREQQRDEMRQRFEERRKEIEAFREGPYDRYNLKVNSLAKVLEMDESQKQAYFDLAKAYSDKFEAGRDELRKAREAKRAQEGEEGAATNGEERGGRRGRGRDDETRDQYRELYTNLQTEFDTGVQSFLTPVQVETYNELSSSSRSLQNLGMVSAPGEQSAFGRFGSQMMGGRGGGGRGGGGRRGR